MINEKKRMSKTTLLIILSVIICLALGARLFWIQVVKKDYYSGEAAGTVTSTVSVKAARGEILDTNGNPLVSNRQTTSIIFNASYFPSSSENDARNSIIEKLIITLNKSGEKWNDTLPIVITKSGNAAFKKNSESEISYLKSKNYLDLNSYATAENCLNALIEMYELESYPLRTARNIASVRYGMVIGAFSVSNPYCFADDVSDETASMIKENGSVFTGVDTSASTIREYADGTVAPHLLGVIGSINEEEYSEHKSEGYTIDDTIGKSGIEKSMESYLRGKTGEQTVYTASDGTVTTKITTPPVQGNTVVLTIDTGLQKTAQKALKAKIDSLRSAGNPKAAGAVVAIDCNSGEILCSATYPSYDLNSYEKDYNKLVKDTVNTPLWDRATLSAYAPGSTFKPCMSIAGLEENVITPSTAIYCPGYLKISDMTFKCLDSHGALAVDQAINHSCNVFFYTVGQKLGINKMNEYATMFGLGLSTGIEIPETTGTLAGPAEREASSGSWYIGDTVQAAIGQSDNLFTPVQLANYVATIANGGTRYQAHFVKSVVSADESTIVLDNSKPKVAYELDISGRTLSAVKRGMELVGGPGGYCWEAFKSLPVKAAAKTGTSQITEYRNGAKVIYNNGLLITYAPADNPRIAIASVIERADSGSSTANIAASIYKYYFNHYGTKSPLGDKSDGTTDTTSEGTLLG